MFLVRSFILEMSGIEEDLILHKPVRDLIPSILRLHSYMGLDLPWTYYWLYTTSLSCGVSSIAVT
jgi:hypothetical protein